MNAPFRPLALHDWLTTRDEQFDTEIDGTPVTLFFEWQNDGWTEDGNFGEWSAALLGLTINNADGSPVETLPYWAAVDRFGICAVMAWQEASEERADNG